ncbi:cytochrome c oxidase assembly protein [Egicoccus halophilus]|uniref:Membrane protein n=1 Tax=Egicoccus halophilus TaxID=1670830 RepID=A0A8J3A5I2_9ACTN|nr:cytochrome c oxidase assembly protein [Egicoccus halophilus]GGI03016.1 membrane protein [Egicoccus halophilus]
MVPAALLPLAAIAAVHWRGASHRDLPSWRRWAFLAGVAAVALALGPLVEPRADTSFAWHMVQHQLLTLVAAPTLAAGQPVRTLFAGIGRPLPDAWRLPGDPGLRVVAAAVCGVAVMLAWHVPAFYEAALADVRLHAVEHLTLLGSAVVLWSAILAAAETSRTVLAAVLGAAVSAIGGAALGILLLGSSELLYPWYAGQPDALSSQRIGGALMKVTALVVYVGTAVTLIVRWLARQQRTPQPSGLPR